MKKIIMAVLMTTAGARAALNVDTLSGTNISATNAWMVGYVTSTGIANPNLVFYWGTSDIGATASGWPYTNAAGTSGVGAVSSEAASLTGGTLYYYRLYAADASNTAWSGVSVFRATPIPTNLPAPGTVSLSADTNGVLTSPTNLCLPDNTGTNLTERVKKLEATSGSTYTSASLINVAFTPTNWTAAAANVEEHLIAADTAIGAHVGNTSNPHAVTAAQLGAASTATVAAIDGRVTALEATTPLYRYAAMTNSGEEIEVLATAAGVTAARVSTTITVTIPAGVRVLSMRVRWNGANGSAFTLDMGTNDMTNAGLADRWAALFQAYNEDTGALIAGASCRLDSGNHDELEVMGLPTGATSHLRFGF